MELFACNKIENLCLILNLRNKEDLVCGVWRVSKKES